MSAAHEQSAGFTLLELIVFMTVCAIISTALFAALRPRHDETIDYPTLARIAHNALEIAKGRIYLNKRCETQACRDSVPLLEQSFIDCDPTQANLPLGFCRMTLGPHVRYTIALTTQPDNLKLEPLSSTPMWRMQAYIEVFSNQSATTLNWQSVAHLQLTSLLNQ